MRTTIKLRKPKPNVLINDDKIAVALHNLVKYEKIELYPGLIATKITYIPKK